MHYYTGPLPQPHTREHWEYFRPYGKCTFDDGRVVLFNRGYHAIFERCPGQRATMFAGQGSTRPRDGEQMTFFYHDGTDPRDANRRIDAELIALGLPPLLPMPRLSTEGRLGRLQGRLLRTLRRQFPEVWFHVEWMNGLGGNGRWHGSHQVRILWVDGPTETVAQTVVGEIAGVACTFERTAPPISTVAQKTTDITDANFDGRSKNH